MPRWLDEMKDKLALPDAGRVFSFPELLQLGRETRGQLSPQSFRMGLQKLINDGVVEKPVHGIYLNALSSPKPTPKEVAHLVRKDSVISLSSSLSLHGIMQRSTMVTSVLSLDRNPQLGEVKAAGARFGFYGLPDKFFGDESLMSDKPFPCFIPEKALIDWIHLGSSGRSNVPPPPLDMDTSRLDMKKVFELSRTFGVERHLEEWMLRVSAAKAHLLLQMPKNGR